MKICWLPLRIFSWKRFQSVSRTPSCRGGDGVRGLSCALGAPPAPRAEPVEADVDDRGRDRGLQPDAARLHFLRELRFALDRHAHRLVELIRADAGRVVVPLQELVPVGDALLLSAVDDAVEDRKSTRLNSSHGYTSYARFFL